MPDDDKVESLPTDFSKTKDSVRNKLVEERKKEWNNKITEKTREVLKASKAAENAKRELDDLYDQAVADLDEVKRYV